MQELHGFLGLPDELTRKDSSRVVVVPVPFEASTSYGKGTHNGPDAIIEASWQVEFWDEKLRRNSSLIGIFTDEPIGTNNIWDITANELENKCLEILSENKFPLFLGGEHSISAPIVKGAVKKYPDLSVLHFDAHADLRYEYEDKLWSHASVMRRIFEMNIPFCSAGIRSLSEEEHELIDKHNLKVFFAYKLRKNKEWMDEAISSLSNHVYLTFDIDAVDISEVRATGTPEPGGIYWYEIIEFLDKLSCSGKKVIGADLVELAPEENDNASSFYAAKLAYKIISYLA